MGVGNSYRRFPGGIYIYSKMWKEKLARDSQKLGQVKTFTLDLHLEDIMMQPCVGLKRK